MMKTIVIKVGLYVRIINKVEFLLYQLIYNINLGFLTPWPLVLCLWIQLQVTLLKMELYT